MRVEVQFGLQVDFVLLLLLVRHSGCLGSPGGPGLIVVGRGGHKVQVFPEQNFMILGRSAEKLPT